MSIMTGLSAYSAPTSRLPTAFKAVKNIKKNNRHTIYTVKYVQEVLLHYYLVTYYILWVKKSWTCSKAQSV